MTFEHFIHGIQQCCFQILSWNFISFTIISSVFAWIVYKIIEEQLSPLNKIPSPPGRLPLVGHLFTLIKAGSLHYKVQEWNGKYGPIVRFNSGLGFGIGAERVIVYGPDLIKKVLVTNSYKFNRSKFIKSLVRGAGNGVFASNGADHARQRKMINPAFSIANLRTFFPAFAQCSATLVKLWSDKIKDSPTIAIEDDICHLTLDVIGQTSFGYSFNTVLGNNTKVSEAFRALISGANLGHLIRARFIPFYKYLPLPDNVAIRRSLELVNETVFKVISERRMLRKQGKAIVQQDLLNLLLNVYDEETGAGFDDEELRAQVFTFMFAGHETTSVSLSWTLYELAKHPDIQDKIRQEINTVLKEDVELTWDKLEDLEYLGCVIKESLRLHSPPSDVLRESNQSVNLRGYEIPKGTTLLIPIDALHLSPDNWENPLEFIPERFMKNESPPRSQYSFFPFSIGPRFCIGYKFAMAEMKTVLLSLMRHFKFTTLPGFQVKSKMTLMTRPDPPVKLQVTLLDEDS